MEWKKLFTAKTLERGSEYAKAGKVQKIQYTPRKISAKIEGERKYTATILFDKSNEIIDMKCTCPSSSGINNCKHCAAVLYKADLKEVEKFDYDSWMKHIAQKDNIVLADLKNVYYKDSKEIVPETIIMRAIVPYLEQMLERPKRIGSYKTDFIDVKFDEEADRFAEMFDKESFAKALGKVFDINHAHAKPQILIPLCRFGTPKQIKKVVSYIGKWNDWNEYSSSGRSTIIVARGALMLSDTREAMLYIEKCKLLRKYADIRGMDEDSIRDSTLADFGFDVNGKIVYDLGNTIVEVTMAQDLTLSIYDIVNKKILKSIPKRGVDAEKYEEASANFAEIKSNVKKVVKARKDLLFEEFLTGASRSGSSWKKSYIDNPVLRKVAELLVWTDGKKNFTLANGMAIDSNKNEYELSNEYRISVAHPMEMTNVEIAKWQKYFLSHGLKQPFVQIWEPVINFETFQEDRYCGFSIPFYRFCGQSKHGIKVEDLYFHDDINITFDGFSAEVERIDLARHAIDVNHRFKIKSIKPYGKFSRRHNHVIAYLDKCTIYGRIKNDDASVVDFLDVFTLAQIMDFIKFANENNCTSTTAAIMAYKNEHYGNESVMDEFVL